MKSIEEIMMYEVKGLAKTVCDYSTDNYIISYAKQLSECTYPKDYVAIKYLVTQLLMWYEKEIEIIQQSSYVYGKQGHQKTMKILQDLSDQLDIHKNLI